MYTDGKWNLCAMLKLKKTIRKKKERKKIEGVCLYGKKVTLGKGNPATVIEI